jgi:hypothetical protein
MWTCDRPKELDPVILSIWPASLNVGSPSRETSIMLCVRIDVTQDVFAVAVRIGATPFNGLPERDDQGPGSPFKREYRAVLDRRSI